MYSAVDIANIFVNKGIQDGKPVTQMQLQKLVYFAYGALLAITDGKERLVYEKFQAWDYGPVIPDIYNRYKIYGSKLIATDDKFELEFLGKKNILPPIQLNSGLHQKVVDETWEFLKDIDGLKLSAWTHKEKSAWSKVYQPGTKNIFLNEQDVITDFKPLLKIPQNG